MANENIRSKTGMRVDEITLEAVLGGGVSAEDIKISGEVLKGQACTARTAGRAQLGENFERAAEMVSIPDGELLEMYNLLRPKRATKGVLLEMAERLESVYGAVLCARLVREAAEVYDKRGVLL